MLASIWVLTLHSGVKDEPDWNPQRGLTGWGMVPGRFEGAHRPQGSEKAVHHVKQVTSPDWFSEAPSSKDTACSLPDWSLGTPSITHIPLFTVQSCGVGPRTVNWNRWATLLLDGDTEEQKRLDSSLQSIATSGCCQAQGSWTGGDGAAGA